MLTLSLTGKALPYKAEPRTRMMANSTPSLSNTLSQTPAWHHR